MCLSMFSGVSLAKAYSPLTARELSSGEHAQRQAEAAHAERKAEEEPKAEEELKAKEDAEAEDEGSTLDKGIYIYICCIFSIVRAHFEKYDLYSAPIARALPCYIVLFFKFFKTGKCFKTMLFPVSCVPQKPLAFQKHSPLLIQPKTHAKTLSERSEKCVGCSVLARGAEPLPILGVVNMVGTRNFTCYMGAL